MNADILSTTAATQPAGYGTPRVAVATVVFDDEGRVLVIERMPDSPTGGGDLAIPGGKLDPGESLMDGAVRELFEETGVEAHSIQRLSVITEDRLWGPEHHFVTHYFVVTSWSGTPEVKEPTKHRIVDWISPRQLAEAMEPDHDPRAPAIFDPLGHLILDGGIDEALKIWRRFKQG